MWDGDNQFEIATTRSETDYLVANTSGVHSGDDVSQQVDERIFEALSRHYGVSIVNGGYVDYTSTSDVSVSELGQIWIGEGTVPAINALSLDDMAVGVYVPVTVNAVIGSLANVLCLISKANDNTVDIAVCLGGDGEGCFIWDGTQIRFLPDNSVDTFELSSAVGSALSESEHREINIGTIIVESSFTPARPSCYVNAAEPVEIPFTVVVRDGVLSGQYLGIIRPLVFNGRINNPNSDYLCIANADSRDSNIELTSYDSYNDCADIQSQDFDSVIDCSNTSASANDGFVVTAYNNACTIEESLDAINATLSVLFDNREICKIANCGNSTKPFISYE